MITQSELYWITRLDYIGSFFMGLAVFMVIPITFCIANYFIALEERRYVYNQKEIKRLNSTIQKSIIGLIISLFLALIWWIACVLTPSTKDMCMIKVIPMLANSEMVQQLSQDGKEIYTLGINRIKKELTGENE